MKRFFAFSGGVESTTLALLFGQVASGIFADTGWEHQEMYQRIEKVEKKIKQIHHIEKDELIIKVRNKESLPEIIERKNFFPGFKTRFCTLEAKIKPVNDFLRTQGECELMIGLNADETKRVGNISKLKNVKYSYPLRDNGITRASCIELLSKFNLLPNFPPYMQRGGCIGCFFKSLKEFKAMAALNPEEFQQVEDLEQKIQDKRGKFYAIRENFPMSQIRSEVENSLFAPSEMYISKDSSIQIQTTCGVFCHR